MLEASQLVHPRPSTRQRDQPLAVDERRLHRTVGDEEIDVAWARSRMRSVCFDSTSPWESSTRLTPPLHSEEPSCSPSCSLRPPSPTPTATCTAGCTTRPRPRSRRSRWSRPPRSTPSPTTRSSAPAASRSRKQRAEETKHHLMVLWADFFAPDHFAAVPAAPRAVLEGDPPGRRGQEVDGPRRWRAAAWPTSTRSPTSSGRPTRRSRWVSTPSLIPAWPRRL